MIRFRLCQKVKQLRDKCPWTPPSTAVTSLTHSLTINTNFIPIKTLPWKINVKKSFILLMYQTSHRLHTYILDGVTLYAYLLEEMLFVLWFKLSSRLSLCFMKKACNVSQNKSRWWGTYLFTAPMSQLSTLIWSLMCDRRCVYNAYFMASHVAHLIKIQFHYIIFYCFLCVT